jgi:hypothetical protein
MFWKFRKDVTLHHAVLFQNKITESWNERFCNQAALNNIIKLWRGDGLVTWCLTCLLSWGFSTSASVSYLSCFLPKLILLLLLSNIKETYISCNIFRISFILYSLFFIIINVPSQQQTPITETAQCVYNIT